MRVVVLGTGAVGGYYGGQLARAGHEVTCFARGANLAALRERGLEIQTPEGTHRTSVSATDRVADLPPADFTILGVKSYSLDAMAPALIRCAQQGATIVPLLNGVDTAERLVALGVPAATVVGGLTRVSVVLTAPGVVTRSSAFQSVVVGEFDGTITLRVESIAAAFRDAGVDGKASGQIQLELWRKFVFIAALAAGCGLARAPIGHLQASPLGRRLLERAIREVIAVARARGIPFPDDEESRHIGMIGQLPPTIKPSFLVDLEGGGPNELEILSGAVSRFADELGVPTPVHDTVTAALRKSSPTAAPSLG